MSLLEHNGVSVWWLLPLAAALLLVESIQREARSSTRGCDNPPVGVGPILICYDGSPGAQQAIAVAGALLTGRHAVVLDVGPLDLVAETYAAAGSGASDVGQAVYTGALAQAEAGAALARHAGFDAEPRAGIDAPTWRGITEVANELDAAVIVLGSERRTGLGELLEGSVSHEVAEHAGRPVLVVPPAASGH